MHNYIVLNTAFLAAVALLCVALHYRYKLHLNRRSLLYSLAILLVLTIIFDSLLIHLELFYYDPARLLGLYIGKAPVEDFAYPVGSLLLVATLWEVLENRDAKD